MHVAATAAASVGLVLLVSMAGAAWGQDSASSGTQWQSEPASAHPPRELPNDPGDRDHNLGKTHTLKQVQAELNNPLSSLWSLQLQNTVQFNRGSPSTGTSRGIYTGLFQPAMPVPLTKDWTLINRPIFSWLNTPTFDPLTSDWDRTSGVGPLTYEGWITPTKPSKLQLALGAVTSIPLSTRDELNSGKYTLGPSAVAVYKHGDWILGTLSQYQWSISGSDKRENVSQLSVQYFVIWQGLPNHWQLNMSPTITYNKKANGPDAWAVPVGIGLGKMVKIGKVPTKLQLEFQAYPIHPESFGPRYAIVFKLTPVIPALVKKSLF
jgi:hypothetical protein